jgi:hypothetical protein
MSGWTSGDARALAGSEEVEVRTRRADGSLRDPVTIWVVAVGDRVFVRSTNGRGAAWFRRALATGSGQVAAHGIPRDVGFAEAAASDLDRVDAAYRTKYGRYASIVDHLEESGPRAATLEVTPADPAPQSTTGRSRA